jgi:hypothetical protein
VEHASGDEEQPAEPGPEEQHGARLGIDDHGRHDGRVERQPRRERAVESEGGGHRQLVAAGAARCRRSARHVLGQRDAGAERGDAADRVALVAGEPPRLRRLLALALRGLTRAAARDEGARRTDGERLGRRGAADVRAEERFARRLRDGEAGDDERDGERGDGGTTGHGDLSCLDVRSDACRARA